MTCFSTSDRLTGGEAEIPSRTGKSFTSGPSQSGWKSTNPSRENFPDGIVDGQWERELLTQEQVMQFNNWDF